jgi:hypothetical protein
MTLTLYIECDVAGCQVKAEPEGADISPITGEGLLDLDEFRIDQIFYLPKGWTYTNDLSTCPENLHLCPDHTEDDIGVEGAIRALHREQDEGTGRIGDPYTTSDGSDDPNRASTESPLTQLCPINTYPGQGCDLPPGHTGLHATASEKERAGRVPLNVCRCGHDIRWHRPAEQVGKRMVEAGPCAGLHMGEPCSCSFFRPPSRRNLHVQDKAR